MTNQVEEIEEAPQTDPAQKENRILSRTTLIFAIVVLAAVAVVIILASR